MIHFVKGDLLDSNVQVLVNPVNCRGAMGKGLALQFRQRFPSYYEHYRGLCAGGLLQLGRVYVYADQVKGVSPVCGIVNFPTKDHWSDVSTYESIDTGLCSLVEAITKLKITSIAIPMLGCGEGKLGKPSVLQMIVNRMSHLHQCSIYLYNSTDD